MVVPMWDSGPLRLWSEKRTGNTPIALANGSYAGPYVCSECQRPVGGVYQPKSDLMSGKWLCGTCRG